MEYARWGSWAVLVAGAFALFAPSALADIYKYVDKYGRVTLTDRPDKSGAMKLVKTWKGWVSRPVNLTGPRFIRDREQYSALIAEAAGKNRLPVELVHAVITAESSYNPDAVSHAGAVGLMQLMPETAQRYGVADRYNPVQNVNGGTKYLSDLMGMFNKNVILAVAAYNAGENAVIGYGNKVPPYAETQQYVRRVVHYFKRYAEDGVGRTVAKPTPITRTSTITPITVSPGTGAATTAATTKTRTIGDAGVITSGGGTTGTTLAETLPVSRKPVVNTTQVWPRPKKRIAIIKWADEED